VIKDLGPLAKRFGLNMRIVGSVDREGQSAKDLDLLFSEQDDDFDWEGFTNELAERGWQWAGTSMHGDNEAEAWLTPDGRTVDMFFGEYDPDHALTEDIEDWSGHWILPDNRVLETDIRNDQHHIELAFEELYSNVNHLLDEYDSEEEALEDEYFREFVEEAASNDGWIRTMIRDGQFAIDLPSNATRSQRRILQKIIKEHPDMDMYYLNDKPYTEKRQVLRTVME
jgi:hypothetical protein